MDNKEFIKLPMNIRRDVLALQVDNLVCHKAIDDFYLYHQGKITKPTVIHWEIKQLLDLAT